MTDSDRKLLRKITADLRQDISDMLYISTPMLDKTGNLRDCLIHALALTATLIEEDRNGSA